MAPIRKVCFTEIRINGKSIDGPFEGPLKNACDLSQREDGNFLIVTVADDVNLELDVRKSVSELKFSNWDEDAEIQPIIDLTIMLAKIPKWMLEYTTAPIGCVQWIHLTMKFNGNRSNYNIFTYNLRSILSSSQWKSLQHANALQLWDERCTPPDSVAPTVKSLDISPKNLQYFSVKDLDRLKKAKEWLTDSHINFCLKDFYQNAASENIWGNVKIKLLDTIFWTKLSATPDGYNEKYRKKTNLIDYDFVVMPMFGESHWRLGIVEKPGELLEGKTVFHILDSLQDNTFGRRECSQLQKILIKHFEGSDFEEGRISVNVANVPRQPNSSDCGCFLIFFTKKFFMNPDVTIRLIKSSFLSSADGLEAWGLKNDNLTFIRREIRTLLLKYIKEGEAVVEYEE